MTEGHPANVRHENMAPETHWATAGVDLELWKSSELRDSRYKEEMVKEEMRVAPVSSGGLGG